MKPGKSVSFVLGGIGIGIALCALVLAGIAFAQNQQSRLAHLEVLIPYSSSGSFPSSADSFEEINYSSGSLLKFKDGNTTCYVAYFYRDGFALSCVK